MFKKHKTIIAGILLITGLSSCGHRLIRVDEAGVIPPYQMTTVDMGGHTLVLIQRRGGVMEIGHLNTHCRPPHK